MSTQNGLRVGDSSDTDHGNEQQTRDAPSKRTVVDWLRDDVNIRYTDIPVLACCLVSGLCDSVAVNAAGVFVSMQTGNTIFMALGASRLPAGEPLLWLKSLSSIAAFWLGCFFFSKSRHIHPKRRSTLALSFLLQASLIFLAAAFAQTRLIADFGATSVQGSDSNHEFKTSENPLVMVPLALLAFQFGGQIVTSRILGYNEVPTNVLTSVYCDLLSDPKLFAPLKENPKRNRRFLAVVLLVLGGILGGWLQRSQAGMPGALWISGAVKLIIAIAWMGWASNEPAESKLEKGVAKS
ncbi:hypothetical protein CH063_00150 [Colletotrichum higginsianum]|uniref:Duf1275 domain protein n=2 Tax=Colletotrichum higginsianum TaxID=80884 RepID=H1V0Q2_COLHI|nr:Duf1275 domain protein [Colletotrichum higginsianum IMI 349063]OBR08203.1 Duf1275 domain protein [Colletotrichum higginsianum IMI 349063]TIC89535.1 hypothetical protein CH35J_012819 [Colletotrichum higginsianum]GJC97716.1 DUF1275 domain protein [Colletotrichum higginsianum]CCF33803.1 hypothetical protein CH063_00150 [Colletotrichum higginsianum]